MATTEQQVATLRSSKIVDYTAGRICQQLEIPLP